MAERRMFSKKIIDSDAFLDMPLSTQALYFHLSMRADDEGFVGNPKRIRSMIGASEDDLKLLIVKRFILTFESGVVVIKDWRIHNYINPDRFTPTTYIAEAETLTLDGKKSYTEKSNQDVLQGVAQPVLQNGDNSRTQDRLDKDRLGKGRINKGNCAESASAPKVSNRFVKPTIEEVADYCRERNNGIDAQQFFDFYESKGWKVGNQPMKDWRACVRTWEKRGDHKPNETPRVAPTKYKRGE